MSRPFALAALAALALCALAGPVPARLQSRDAVARALAVQDLVRGRDAVSGTLVNRTGDEIRAVRLLVVDAFHWRDERNPGDDDPGGATAVTVPGPVPPHGSAPFRVAVPVRPARADGRWATSVDVLGFERQPLR